MNHTREINSCVRALQVTYRNPAMNLFVNGKALLPRKTQPAHAKLYTRCCFFQYFFHFILSSKKTHHWAVTQTKDCFFKSVFALNPTEPRYAPAFVDNLRKTPLASSAAAGVPAESQDHHHQRQAVGSHAGNRHRTLKWYSSTLYLRGI